MRSGHTSISDTCRPILTNDHVGRDRQRLRIPRVSGINEQQGQKMIGYGRRRRGADRYSHRGHITGANKRLLRDYAIVDEDQDIPLTSSYSLSQWCEASTAMMAATKLPCARRIWYTNDDDNDAPREPIKIPRINASPTSLTLLGAPDIAVSRNGSMTAAATTAATGDDDKDFDRLLIASAPILRSSLTPSISSSSSSLISSYIYLIPTIFSDRPDISCDSLMLHHDPWLHKPLDSVYRP